MLASTSLCPGNQFVQRSMYPFDVLSLFGLSPSMPRDHPPTVSQGGASYATRVKFIPHRVGSGRLHYHAVLSNSNRAFCSSIWWVCIRARDPIVRVAGTSKTARLLCRYEIILSIFGPTVGLGDRVAVGVHLWRLFYRLDGAAWELPACENSNSTS